MFKALVLEETSGKVSPAMRELDEQALPAGDVTVAVEYSDLNFKDGMILKGMGRLVRKYPHVPGIDFAGTVTASSRPEFPVGSGVILTGWRVGEVHWGGYAQRARVSGDWLVPLPPGLSAKRAMALGTAGFTAMLALMALEEHGVTPGSGDVLITGAAGGVGSVATALLAARGYGVAASTGRAETHDYLRALGAKTIVNRSELSEPTTRPLDAERWAGAIDTVGSTTLSKLLTQVAYHGSVASVGLAAGDRVDLSVIPFLIRGINLLGIDSATCPAPRRRAAWDRLVREMPMDRLDAMTTTVKLADLPALAGDIIAGKVRGRVVVDVNA